MPLEKIGIEWLHDETAWQAWFFKHDPSDVLAFNSFQQELGTWTTIKQSNCFLGHFGDSNQHTKLAILMVDRERLAGELSLRFSWWMEQATRASIILQLL